MGESKHTPLSDAEVAEAYEEEMKGPQGVSFTLRDDHLLARAHRALMLEALRALIFPEAPSADDLMLLFLAAGVTSAQQEAFRPFVEKYRAAQVKARAAIKAATGGAP